MGFKTIFTSLKKGPIPPDEKLKQIPSFMFCRYLSTHPYTINPANVFNIYYKQIPVEIQYKMIKSIFAGKGIYCTMPKKSKSDENLDVLCKHYKISRDKAKEYREFLSDDEFNKIQKMYEIKG